MKAQMAFSRLTLGDAVRLGKEDSVRILVAEDDLETRKLMAERLRRNGFEVVAVGDGLAALDRLCGKPSEEVLRGFDVVIADIRMPGMTGLDLLTNLRCTHRDLPIILITAFGSAETHEQAKRLGAWTVLDKPFDLERLEAAVRNAA